MRARGARSRGGSSAAVDLPCLHPTCFEPVRKPCHVACWDHWIAVPPDVRKAYYEATRPRRRSGLPPRFELADVVEVIADLWVIDMLTEASTS